MTAYPEILKTCSGETIDTAIAWETYRRPEILALFSNFVYGNMPFACQLPVCFSEEGEERTVWGYRRRKIMARTETLAFFYYLYLPDEATHRNRVPVVFYNMFGWEPEQAAPVQEILKRGYAFCALPVNGVASDSPHSFETGIFQIAGRNGINPWGAISAWAWGASRVMDYLETVREILPDKVAVGGHSRGGKTALWEFAVDQRFAACLSLNSGCGGASTSRDKGPDCESVASITANLGYWFTERFQNYGAKEYLLPVDQHMLLALAAPRPVYVVSATEDLWADPDGELRSCRMAGGVYALYGREGLIMNEPVKADKSYQDGTIAYHRRTGGHGFTAADWSYFLDFTDKIFCE